MNEKRGNGIFRVIWRRELVKLKVDSIDFDYFERLWLIGNIENGHKRIDETMMGNNHWAE